LKKLYTENNLLISVVIITYNRCDKLKLALDGLTKQNLDKTKFEVLVIDNNSTDDTRGTVENYQENLYLRYYLERKQGGGYARDAGFRKARGEYVAFLDDDAIPTEDWIQALQQNIITHEPDCLCGPIIPYYTSEKPHWFKDEYEIRTLGGDWHVMPEGTTYSGSNMTWKRSILYDVGGFDANLGVSGDKFIGGEDTDLFDRYWRMIRGKVIYDPKVEVLHWTPDYKMRVSYMLKRFLAVGVSQAKLNKRVSVFKKLIRALQLGFEMMASLLIFPFTFYRHKHIENWIVEEGRRLMVRVGEFITMMGIEPRIRQK
jgi:glycosyltransferase involved in cell wall biosynthesis